MLLHHKQTRQYFRWLPSHQLPSSAPPPLHPQPQLLYPCFHSCALRQGMLIQATQTPIPLAALCGMSKSTKLQGWQTLRQSRASWQLACNLSHLRLALVSRILQDAAALQGCSLLQGAAALHTSLLQDAATLQLSKKTHPTCWQLLMQHPVLQLRSPATEHSMPAQLACSNNSATSETRLQQNGTRTQAACRCNHKQ